MIIQKLLDGFNETWRENRQGACDAFGQIYVETLRGLFGFGGAVCLLLVKFKPTDLKVLLSTKG